MTYFYIKALHIIFIVTWFAGLFYFPRLLIYNTEANDKPLQEKEILQQQFAVMLKRLWYGITWPSAILTLIFGIWVLFSGNWNSLLFKPQGKWLLIKLAFVVLLYVYHFSLEKLYKQQSAGIYKYSSQQLRIWNEVATIILVSVVFLATVKQGMSLVWGVTGLILFILLLMSAIKIYKTLRTKKGG